LPILKTTFIQCYKAVQYIAVSLLSDADVSATAAAFFKTKRRSEVDNSVGRQFGDWLTESF